MRVDEFDFELPKDRIALRPAIPRDSARLLLVQPGAGFSNRTVRDLPDLLEPGDALVFNDTRVIPAQLEGLRLPREGQHPPAKVSATLHMRAKGNTWKAFLRPAKRVRIGDLIIFSKGEEDLSAQITDCGDGGEFTLEFNQSTEALDLAIIRVGHIPLPPYIASQRGEDEHDRVDYQTVYARENGAVAAPTAGLHFTEDLLDRLDAKGVQRHFVTLHVGAGTFLPVKAEDTNDHKMHAEIGVVSASTADALNQVRATGGRIVSVGTTSMRLLESATDNNQQIRSFHGETDIFITPGYKFKAVDILMTNFHLPRSTLMMLVSAFAGLDTMKDAYQYAIANGYRFYSYGDSSLIFPKGE